jgi:hypothetical protein
MKLHKNSSATKLNNVENNYSQRNSIVNKNEQSFKNKSIARKYTKSGFTIKDLTKLSIEEQIKQDDTNFFVFFWNDLITYHSWISLVFKKSVINPFHIRFISLMYGYSMTMCLNVLFYSEDYINKQASFKEKNSDITFYYIIINELSKSLWSVLIQIIVITLIGIIKSPPESYQKELNEHLISDDEELIIKGW